MSKLRTASWILLVVAGALVLVGALASANLAYRGEYRVGGVAVSDVALGREAVLAGLRGARGTAAAWAAAFGLLLVFVAAGPYRQGSVASWWGILVSTLALLGLAALRIPLVGTSVGTGEPLVLTVVVVVALLLDVRRLSAPR
ncbi:MAG: hypothetical protein ACM3PV_01660 [Betaproteobacteria bacterium]